MLLLTPRIFADSFYNSKDLAFLSAFIISIFTLDGFHQHQDRRWLLIHAFTSAFVIDIRLAGLLIPLLTIFTNYRQRLTILLGYVLLTGVLVTLFWPILWTQPFHQFVSAIKLMSNYQWRGLVLFQGHFIPSYNLPWYYLPVWFAITTPISIFLLGFTGSIFTIWRIILRHNRFLQTVSIIWFYLPLTYIVILRPELYDGWRHLYFIYPAWIILCIPVVKYLLQITRTRLIKSIFILLIIIDLTSVAVFMIKNHPYQNVYFNQISGSIAFIKTQYETDYWGLSLTEGFITKHDPSPIIKVFAPLSPGAIPALILPANQRERLQINTTHSSGAKYFIGDYRWHPHPYSIPTRPIFEKKVENIPLVSVYDISQFNNPNWY
jgi:hypothetical protein